MHYCENTVLYKCRPLSFSFFASLFPTITLAYPILNTYSTQKVYCGYSHMDSCLQNMQTLKTWLTMYCNSEVWDTQRSLLAHTCKSANVADHGSGKYYTVSTCGHSLIHVCTCMEMIIRSSWEECYT